MKEFPQGQRRRLYVVTTPLSADEVSDFSRNSLDRSFQNWLGSVEPMEGLKMSARSVVTTISNDFEHTGIVRRSLQLCPPVSGLVPEQASAATLFPAKLTTQEYVQVMLATIREGASQPRWPREVVEHFLAAEVIASNE